MTVSGTATGRRAGEDAGEGGLGGFRCRGRSWWRVCSWISQASPSRRIEPPELTDCTNGWSGMKSVGSFSKAPPGSTRSRMSPPSDWAEIFQLAGFAGWLARALSNSAALAGSFSIAAPTGDSRVKDFCSFRHCSSQICQDASARQGHGFSRLQAWRAR